MIVRRLCVALVDVPAFECDGWRVLWPLPQPMRGTDVLMEWRA